jgi:hypothetical protein
MKDITTPKIICIGWHKTGTSTMGDALITLGFNVVGARLDLANHLLNNNTQAVIDVAKEYDALQDVPWAVLFKELDNEFPNSKFILTIRDERNWLHSAKKHFGDSYTAMRKWIYGNGILNGNENLYIERYRKHYSDVKDYFKDRPDDIIVMDLKNGAGWNKLCSFLNKPIPKKAFPHSNKGKHNYGLKDKMIWHLRKLSPSWLKQLRFYILIKLGLPDKRDRFNNKQYNSAEHKKRKKAAREL